MNDILSVCECSLSNCYTNRSEGDTRTIIKFASTFSTQRQCGF